MRLTRPAIVALLAVAAVMGVALAVLLTAPGESAFPGTNGKIAFYRNGEIYVMNADGTGQTNLTNNPATDYVPAWSPDGTKIAFYSDRDGNPEVYVMNADGSGVTNLTSNAASEQHPAWSPDGTKIAFLSSRDGNWEIYTMNTDGSSQTRLTSNAVDDVEPDWQPVPTPTPTPTPTPSPTPPIAVGGIVELRTGPNAPSERSASDSRLPLGVSVSIGLLVMGAGGLYVVRMRRG